MGHVHDSRGGHRDARDEFGSRDNRSMSGGGVGNSSRGRNTVRAGSPGRHDSRSEFNSQT